MADTNNFLVFRRPYENISFPTHFVRIHVEGQKKAHAQKNTKSAVPLEVRERRLISKFFRFFFSFVCLFFFVVLSLCLFVSKSKISSYDLKFYSLW